MDLVTGLIILVILGLSYYYLTQRREGLPPGPRGWPIINNYGYIRNMNELYKKLQSLREHYGDIYSLRFFSRDVIVLNGPDVIRDALVKHADDFSERPDFFVSRHGRQNSGIINNFDSWKEARRFALVALRDCGVGKTSLEDKIHEEVHHLCKALEASKGEPICLDILVNQSVSNIICGIAFGKRFEYDDKKFSHLLNGLNYLFLKFGGPYNVINFNPILQVFASFMLKVLAIKPKAMKVLEELKDLVVSSINEHKETFDPNDIRDLIDLYLVTESAEGQTKVSVEHCFAMIIDLFAAGTETTSTTLKWLILYMIHEPKIQERCYEEITQNIGPNVPVTMKDRAKCPYFEATLLEVQRICTIVPMSVPHGTHKDLRFNGLLFPKGAVIIPNIYSAHHDITYWGDPEVFRPERWLDQEGNIIKHSAFMPFSLGRRACLGEQLAKMEMFLYASSLIQGFKFSMVDPTNPPTKEGVQGITLLPRPYDVKALARSHTV